VPLTLAHPLAAVPFRRPLGRLGVLAALVVGSVMADLPLFMPLPLNRNVTHSFLAVLWFCVPAGVLAYLLYDYVLDQPLRALMPEGLARRLPRTGRAARPPVWSPSVLVSILVGAATHSAWDSFTHGGAAGLGEWLPALETRLFAVSGYTVYVFSVLQHTSTVVGMVVLSAWIWRWYGRAAEGDAAAGALSPRARRMLLIAIALAAVIAAGVAAVSRPPAEATIRHLQPVVRRVVVTSLSTLLGAVTVYAIAWHSLRRGAGSRGRL
jgi:hypothetical protein